MFKKTIAILLIACFALTATACIGGGSAKEDSYSKEALVDIEAYISDAGTYFALPQVQELKVAEGETALDAFVKAATKIKDLPEDLVKTYAESLKGAEDAKDLSDEQLKAKATAFIKEEMVVYYAYTYFKLAEISDDDRIEMASAVAKQEGCKAEDLFVKGNTDTYAIDMIIKADRIEKYLNEKLGINEGAEEDSSAELSADDSSEEAPEDPSADERIREKVEAAVMADYIALKNEELRVFYEAEVRADETFMTEKRKDAESTAEAVLKEWVTRILKMEFRERYANLGVTDETEIENRLLTDVTEEVINERYAKEYTEEDIAEKVEEILDGSISAEVTIKVTDHTKTEEYLALIAEYELSEEYASAVDARLEVSEQQ